MVDEQNMNLEHWWNETGGKIELLGNNLSQYHLSIINSTWTGLGLNPGLYTQRPETCHLFFIIQVLSCVHLYIFLKTGMLGILYLLCSFVARCMHSSCMLSMY
jgi:hypothetical protein